MAMTNAERQRRWRAKRRRRGPWRDPRPALRELAAQAGEAVADRGPPAEAAPPEGVALAVCWPHGDPRGAELHWAAAKHGATAQPHRDRVARILEFALAKLGDPHGALKPAADATAK